MSQKKFIFTEEQIEYIQTHWGQESATSMKKRFGCSWQAVVKKAVELGFEKPKSKESTRWKVEEDCIIRENAKKLTVQQIAELLNRTVTAVYVRANRIGVSLDHEWTTEDEQLLEELWGCYSIETVAKKLHRSVDSIKVKATRMHLGDSFSSNGQFLKVSDIELALNVNGQKIRQTWFKTGLKFSKVKISNQCHIYGVKVEDLWDFLEQHPTSFDARYLEENILGPEPVWLKLKRKQDFQNPPNIEYRPWSENEIKLLTYLLTQGKSQEEIGRILHRSRCAVNAKIYKMNLTFPNFWEPSEIQLLQQNYENGFSASYQELSEDLGRSADAIRRKAKSLGLSKSSSN